MRVEGAMGVALFFSGNYLERTIEDSEDDLTQSPHIRPTSA